MRLQSYVNLEGSQNYVQGMYLERVFVKLARTPRLRWIDSVIRTFNAVSSSHCSGFNLRLCTLVTFLLISKLKLLYNYSSTGTRSTSIALSRCEGRAGSASGMRKSGEPCDLEANNATSSGALNNLTASMSRRSDAETGQQDALVPT